MSTSSVSSSFVPFSTSTRKLRNINLSTLVDTRIEVRSKVRRYGWSKAKLRGWAAEDHWRWWWSAESRRSWRTGIEWELRRWGTHLWLLLLLRYLMRRVAERLLIALSFLLTLLRISSPPVPVRS